MYRNEEKRAIADKWQDWADLLQFGTLGMLFVSIFILESLTKEQARIVVWYLAAFMFITATIGFFLGRKAIKHKMTYLNAEHARVSGLFDEAEAALKSKSKTERFIAKYRGENL